MEFFPRHDYGKCVKRYRWIDEPGIGQELRTWAKQTRNTSTMLRKDFAACGIPNVSNAGLFADSDGPISTDRGCRRRPETPKEQEFQAESESGEGGIRTLGTREGTPVFETGTFGHSVTSPSAYRGVAS